MTNQNNEQRRDWHLTNRIEGWARPAAKKYTPNLAKRQHILTDSDGRYSSIVTVSIKPATTMYPSPALNIQLSNGNGSAYQRIADLEALKDFATALFSWADSLELTWDQAVEQGHQLETIQQEVETRASMFKELMSQMQDSPEPDQYQGMPQE